MFSRFQAETLRPTSELKYDSTFELLISVLLSAQATDISVNKATAKLYPVANTPETIFALGVNGLSPYIKTIGLFNSKAKNAIATCQILIDRHNSEVPEDRAALEALPGVGRKPPTSFWTPLLVTRLLRSTHIYFEYPIEPDLHRVKTLLPLKTNWLNSFQRNLKSMRTIG